MAIWQLWAVDLSKIELSEPNAKITKKEQNKHWTYLEGYDLDQITKPEDFPKLGDDFIFQYRRKPVDNWREIEKASFASGKYKMLPESWKPYVLDLEGNMTEHFVHVSLKDKELLSYIENPENGQRRVHTTNKPGKYLNKYFPDLSMEVQRKLCVDYTVAVSTGELCITKDPVEIAQIYKNGPNSCMSGNRNWGYGEKVDITHPAAIYGLGDLAIAYLGDLDKATARAVVWPEKKIYGRSYGYIDKINALLEGEGYEAANETNDFTNARLKVVFIDEDKSKIAMPYVDIGQLGTPCDNNEFIRIDKSVHAADHNKKIELRVQTGFAEFIDERPRCFLSKALLKDQPTILVDNEVHERDTFTTRVYSGKGLAIANVLNFYHVMLTADGIYSSQLFNVDGVIFSRKYCFEHPELFYFDEYRTMMIKVENANPVKFYGVDFVYNTDKKLFEDCASNFYQYRENYYDSKEAIEKVNKNTYILQSNIRFIKGSGNFQKSRILANGGEVGMGLIDNTIVEDMMLDAPVGDLPGVE